VLNLPVNYTGMSDYDKGTNKVVQFPAFDEIPEESKKQPAYSISVAEAIYSKYKNNKTAIGSDWGSFFHELRLYGLGKQSPDKYKKFLSGSSNATADVLDSTVSEDTRETARKGWWNVNWENIVSFLPNLRSQVRGAMSEIDWNLRADAIDLDSGATEETRMLELYIGTHPVFSKLINDLKQTANIPIEEQEFIPED